MTQKQLRHCYGLCEMQWCLAISAACVHECRIRREKFVEPIDAPESGSRVRIEHRTALDQEIVQPMIAVQHAKAAGPPVTSHVDVCACRKQYIDHFAVAVVHGGEQSRRAEVAARHLVIDVLPQVRMAFQNRAHAARVVGDYRGAKRFHGGITHGCACDPVRASWAQTTKKPQAAAPTARCKTWRWSGRCKTTSAAATPI